jgi:hypothetical protein
MLVRASCSFVGITYSSRLAHSNFKRPMEAVKSKIRTLVFNIIDGVVPLHYSTISYIYRAIAHVRTSTWHTTTPFADVRTFTWVDTQIRRFVSGL